MQGPAEPYGHELTPLKEDSNYYLLEKVQRNRNKKVKGWFDDS